MTSSSLSSFPSASLSTTTLVTFRLEAPLPASNVQLLGSWDNFNKPYPMSRDRSVGSKHWRGCHTFTNIICDGDGDGSTGGLQQASEPRSGGLMMGGRYWYYYRLDDDTEYHDPAQPSTTLCPLLPGQQLNVLDIPVQVVPDDPDVGDGGVDGLSYARDVFTLDPNHKYLKPEPVLERPPTPPKKAEIVERPTSPRRTTPKDGARLDRTFSNPFALMAMLGEARCQSQPTPAPEMWCDRVYQRQIKSAGDDVEPLSDLDPAETHLAPPGAEGKPLGADLSQELASTVDEVTPVQYIGTRDEGEFFGFDFGLGTHLVGSHCQETNDSISGQLLRHEELGDANINSVADQTAWLQLEDAPSSTAIGVSSTYSGRNPWYSNSGNPDQDVVDEPRSLGPARFLDVEDDHQSSFMSFSNRTSAAWSASSMSGTTDHSHNRSSQPITPTTNSFADFMFDFSASPVDVSDSANANNQVDGGHADASIELFHSADNSSFAFAAHNASPSVPAGFQGYSLPDSEHASVLTLRAPSVSVASKGDNGSGSNAHASPQFVRKTSDDVAVAKAMAVTTDWPASGHSGGVGVSQHREGRSEHRTALQELVEDLGYLGTMIA